MRKTALHFLTTTASRMADIQRADPTVRRRAAYLVALGALMGSVAILAAQAYLPVVEEWLRSDPQRVIQRVQIVAVALIVLSAAPLGLLAVYLFTRGQRICRFERFPIEGERFVRDTEILRADQAVLRGRVLQALAIALALLAGGLAAVLWRLVALASQAPR